MPRCGNKRPSTSRFARAGIRGPLLYVEGQLIPISADKKTVSSCFFFGASYIKHRSRRRIVMRRLVSRWCGWLVFHAPRRRQVPWDSGTVDVTCSGSSNSSRIGGGDGGAGSPWRRFVDSNATRRAKWITQFGGVAKAERASSRSETKCPSTPSVYAASGTLPLPTAGSPPPCPPSSPARAGSGRSVVIDL